MAGDGNRLQFTFRGRKAMLRLALLFLVIALVAAFLGFGFVADMSYDAAKLLFLVFLVLAVLAALGGFARGRPINDVW
jgi:uncharacterized membrane protein YtjA (UPF0391 family)